MKFVVFGSLNIDKTYSLDTIVAPGQTVSAFRMEEFCGGKGLNQAVALRRAGNEVCFAGGVGADGQMLLDALDADGIDRRFVKQKDAPSGHAVIQVDAHGQNCIIILAGANGAITPEDVETTLSSFKAGDLIVLQNEIACLQLILRKAHEKGLIVAFNPSPYNEKIAECDLSCVDYLLINEGEGAGLTNTTDPHDILDNLHSRYSGMNIVLTLGGDGSMYQPSEGERISTGIYKTQAIDTTAAGDTFTGFFLSEILKHGDAEQALHTASVAAGIAVSRKGAVPSIPHMEEVSKHLSAGAM